MSLSIQHNVVVPLGQMGSVDRCITHRWISLSRSIWVATVDGALACAWGLIPPTLMSNQAYLWMHHTPICEQHKFMLVRHSQRMVEEMLRDYPTICGHCMVDKPNSIRWLRWLGARFGDSDGMIVPFTIRKANG